VAIDESARDAWDQFDGERRDAAIDCRQECSGFVEWAQESDHDRTLFQMCEIVCGGTVHDREHVRVREQRFSIGAYFSASLSIFVVSACSVQTGAALDLHGCTERDEFLD